MDNPEPVNMQNLSLEDNDEAEDYNKTIVELNAGLELKDLQNETGAQFEVKAPVEEDPDTNDYFDSDEMFKQLNRECLGEDEEAENDSTTPFEKIGRNMEDITPEKDRKVLKRVLMQGSGSVPVLGVTATVHYNCYLEYSDEPYDSTRLRNKPERYKLGAGGLIAGMELGLSTMRQGELARFLVHPDYAFGEHGVPPRIPPSATILLEMEILKLTDRAELDEYNAMDEEEKKEITFKKKLHVVNTERQEGNELYQTGNNKKALSKYMRGLRILDTAHLRNQEEEDQMKHVQVKLCLNVALCSLKLQQNERAIAHCNRVLDVEPKNPKALYRKGMALVNLGDFTKAHKFLTRAQQQNPSDSSIARALKELDQKWRSWNNIERSRYGKMFPEWQTAASEKEKEKAKATPQGKVSEDFKKIIRERLRVFKDDITNVTEMPFQTTTMTPAELSFLETVTSEMGMQFQRREHVIKIKKPPAQSAS